MLPNEYGACENFQLLLLFIWLRVVIIQMWWWVVLVCSFVLCQFTRTRTLADGCKYLSKEGYEKVLYEQFNRINFHFIGFLNTKKGKKEGFEYVIIKSELILENLLLLFVTW